MTGSLSAPGFTVVNLLRAGAEHYLEFFLPHLTSKLTIQEPELNLECLRPKIFLYRTPESPPELRFVQSLPLLPHNLDMNSDHPAQEEPNQQTPQQSGSKFFNFFRSSETPNENQERNTSPQMKYPRSIIDAKKRGWHVVRISTYALQIAKVKEFIKEEFPSIESPSIEVSTTRLSQHHD